MRAACEPRANHIIKNRKSQRGSRAKDSFLCEGEQELKAPWAAIKLRREEFLAIQQVEDGVGDTQGAAELTSAAYQRGALLANLFEADRDARGVSGLIELDPNIFFADRLEVSCPR